MSSKVQGRFTSDGTNKVLNVAPQVDSVHVINLTQMAASNDLGVEYKWQRGFADKGGVYYFKDGGGNNLNNFVNTAALNPGFSLVNSADQSVGAPVAVTSVTDAAQFVANTGDTSSLATGDIVRLSNIATTTNTRGFDYEVGTVAADTSFAARWALANVPGGAGGAGFYRKVDFDPIFYPRGRFVVNVSQATQAVVTTSVSHGYKVGQTVLFYVPNADPNGTTNAWGMYELDNVEATIVAVDTTANTFTINIDSTGFGAFAWPATISDFATVAPSKMNTAEALNQGVDVNSDARDNRAIRGVVLYAGDFSPAGNNGDVIYWEAESADNVDNQ